MYAYEDQHERAADELRKAIVSDPDAPDLRTRLGEELVKLGRLDAADLEITQALRADPEYADAYLVQASLRLARGDAKGALAALERGVKADPENEDVYIELARVQYDGGDMGASRATLRALIEKVPASVDGHFHYANALAGSGDLAGAAAELRRALDLDPAHADARARLSDVLVAAGRLDDAIAILRDGLDRSDDNLPVAEPLVELLVRRGDLEGARDIVAVLDHDESDPMRNLAIASLFRAVKQPERARELCDAALHKKPDLDRGHLLSGALYDEAKNREAALAEYRKVPSESKDYPEAVRRAAELLRTSGKAGEAAALVDQALKRRPDDDEVIALAADLDEKRGDAAHAMKRLEAALGARPKSETLLYAYGSVIDHAGDWQRSIEIMRKLLQVNPRSASALNFIGYAYAEHGQKLTEAERLLRQAIGLVPGNGYIIDSLGWCLFKQGKVEDALHTLEEASRLAPDEAEILRHLGDVYLARKDRAHAAESYRRALKHGTPDEKLKREIEDALRELEADRSARRP